MLAVAEMSSGTPGQTNDVLQYMKCACFECDKTVKYTCD